MAQVVPRVCSPRAQAAPAPRYGVPRPLTALRREQQGGARAQCQANQCSGGEYGDVLPIQFPFLGTRGTCGARNPA